MPTYKLKDLVQEVISGEWGQEVSDTNTGVKVIRTTNFTNVGKLDFNKEIVERAIDSKKIEKKKLLVGDTIIEKSGGSIEQPVGRVVFFEEEGLYLCNNFTSILRPNQELVVPKYFMYLMFYLYRSKRVLKFQNKTTGIINLKLDQYLKQIDVSIPSKEIQMKIVKALDQVYEIINKRQSQIASLDALTQSIFIEMFSEVEEKVKIGDIAEIQTGSTPSRKNDLFWKNGSIPWIKTAEVKMNYIEESEEFITETALEKTSVSLLPINTVLVAMYGQGVTRGRVGLLKTEATTNQACAAILPNEKFIPEFLFKQLIINYEKLRNLGRGGNQPNLNLSLVKSFEVILPPLTKQAEFNIVSQNIELKKKQLKLSLQYFTELYESLLQKAFKGELF